jgi:Phosphoesterase family
MLKRFSPFVALLIAGCVTTTQAHVGTPPPFPSHVGVKNIVVVILENKNADSAKSQQFMGWLATDGAYLGQYYAITHPSQPNYIAMISGSTECVKGDGDVILDRPHIGRFVTWKTYAEDYPENDGCHTDTKIGKYVRKHNPFISFKDVGDREPCRNIVSFPHFAADLRSGGLPQLSLIIPNLDHDAHDTKVQFADDWLTKYIKPLIEEDKSRWDDKLFVVTFDEDAKLWIFGGDGNRVYTAFWGGAVKQHTVIKDVSYDHYDLLRTIEEVFHVNPMTVGGDGAAHPIGGIWK